MPRACFSCELICEGPVKDFVLGFGAPPGVEKFHVRALRGLTLEITGTQQLPRSGLVLLRVRVD